MALRHQHGHVLASEQRKKEDYATVRKFFYDESGPEKVAQKSEAAPPEAIKFRFAFDPPEDLRHGSSVPDRLDPSTRTSLLNRAEELAKRGVVVTIKEATSQEQRRQKEEAAYSSFEELQAQHEEIYNAKLKMDLDKQDSNFNKIHTLLFGPKPEDLSPFGDWDIYDRVQQHIRQFAYARPAINDVEQNDTTQKLQERLNQSGEQIDTQRRRIRDLTISLRSSAQEISSLKALLTEKQDELTQTKQKAALLQSQLRHMKDVGVVSVPRRQSSVSRDAAPLPSGPSNEAHQELLEDFQLLVSANLQLEQENILLRARVAARGVDKEDLKVALQGSAVSLSAADLKEKERRRKLLDAIVPSSSAVIKLKSSRGAWLRRQERMTCDAMAAHDNDAAVELMKKPSYDAARRQPPPAVKRPAPERAPRTEKKEERVVESVSAPQMIQKTSMAADEHIEQKEIVEQSPLWHSLQKHILGSVAISRADSLRREQAHTAKLRHRIAVLSSEVAELRCDRDASQARADKMGSELKEAKAMLDDVVARCESLSKALEDAHFSPTVEVQRGTRSLALAATGRRARPAQVDTLSADTDKARCKSLEEKLSNFSEIMNERVSELELELLEAREALNAAQVRLARSEGVFAPLGDAPPSASDATTRSESTGFQQKRLTEEYGGVRLALSSGDNVEDDDASEQLRAPQSSQQLSGIGDAPSISAKYERELAQLSSELQSRTRSLAVAEKRVGAIEDELASLKAESRLGVGSTVAHKVAPRLRAALQRARNRLAGESAVPLQEKPAEGIIDEEELAIERLLSLVQAGSHAHAIVQRQLNHKRRFQSLVVPQGGSLAPSVVVDLRIQWLKLLSAREQQLRLCRSSVIQQALIELIRETYEDAMECEEICTSTKRNNAVLGRAAKHFVEWSSNRERDDSSMEMRDIRSLEQLEREQLAWAELLQSQLQLARDIESKRSDIIANEATEVVAVERRDSSAHGLTFVFESTGVETVAAMSPHFCVSPSTALWNQLETAASNRLIVPVVSATTISTLLKVFPKVTFVVRYTMQPHDCLDSVAARFGVATSAVVASPPLRCVDVMCDASKATRALSIDPSHCVLATVESDRIIDPPILCRLLNLSEVQLAEQNAVVPKGQRVYFPFIIHRVNADSLLNFIRQRRVILIHQSTKHETSKSVAIKYGVSVDDVVGLVADGTAVEVVLPSLESLRPHMGSRWFDSIVHPPAMSFAQVEGTKLLSEIAKHSGVSRLQVHVPNLDIQGFIPATPQPAEHLVRCRQLEQIKYAVQQSFSFVSVTVGGSEAYISSNLAAALAALHTSTAIYAIVSLPSWDPSAAAFALSAHVSDVHPWELALSSAQVPKVCVHDNNLAPIEHVVAFKSRLPQIGNVSKEQLDDMVRSIQQDIVEIVTFACPAKLLLRCEIPLIDEKSGIVHIQIIVADQASADAVKQLLDKDGSVSELSHLKSAMLDGGTWSGDRIMLDIVDNSVTAPIGHTTLYHTVVGNDSIATVALRYGVPIPSLINANAAVWFRAQNVAVGRRGRRRVQMAGESDVDVASEEKPLRSFDIRVLNVPCGLPCAMYTIKSIAVDHSMSLLQLSSTAGVPSENIFMDTDKIEWGTGTVLRIPPMPAVRTTATRRHVPLAKDRQQHVVEGRGDTPQAVAARYHISVEALIRENANCVLLPRGSVATIVDTPPLLPVFAVEHELNPDDTLYSIAQMYCVAPQDVLRWNPGLHQAADCDAVIVPLHPNISSAVLSQQFPNVVTFVPDIPLSSIAKTFDCSIDDLAHFHNIVGTAMPGKKAVPLSSVGAVALAKRQRLDMYAIVPLGTESVASTAERAECHISAVLFSQRKLDSAIRLRIVVSADTAARCASSTKCVAENSQLDLFPATRTLVAARSVLLSSSDEVHQFHSRVQLQLQKQSGLAQRHHFLDDRLVDVAARLAMVHMNLKKITGMVDARHAAGEHIDTVVVNRESIGVQTDEEEAPIVVAEEATRVRIPMHDRNSQTNLTGEAVEETLSNISEAQGKEILLETELQELRSERQRLQGSLQETQTALAATEGQCKHLGSQLQSFQLWKAATENSKDGATSIPNPLLKTVMSIGVATEEPWPSTSATLKGGHSTAGSSGELSSAAKSFLAPQGKASLVNTSDTGASKPPSQSIAVQVEPIKAPKRTQVTETDWPEARVTTAVGNSLSPTDPALPNRRPTLQRLVHVVEHTHRDNELAPKSAVEPLCIGFTDIQSSTSLWARAPDAMSDAVEQHHYIIRQLLRVHGGYEVKTIGDSFMVAFQSPADAMDFSMEMQRHLHSNSWPREIDETYYDLAAEQSGADIPTPDPALWNGLRVRVGFNFGICNPRLDSVTGGYDYYGTLVNTAARVEGLGNGGQVLATEAMLLALEEMGFKFDSITRKSLGPQTLRGLDAPVVIHQFSPIEFEGRKYGELRIDRGNELTEEALAASVGSATLLHDVQLRMKLAEEAASAAAGELALERHRSQVALNAQRKESSQRRDTTQQRDVPKRQEVNRRDDVWGSPVVNFSLGHPLTTTRDAGTMTTTNESACARKAGVSSAVIRDEVSAALQAFWHYAEELVRNSISQIVQLCSLEVDAAVVARTTLTAEAIAASVQSVIVQQQLQPGLTASEPLSQDQLFAIREVIKHSSADRPTSKGIALPSIGGTVPLGKELNEMRRSNVSKIKEELVLEPTTPAVPPRSRTHSHSRAEMSRSDRGDDEDFRSVHAQARRANMQSTLIKTFLGKDIDRSPTPPFAPPVAPLAGSLLSGTLVSKAAEVQLEHVRHRVEDEVLTFLRLDTIGAGGPAAGDAVRGLSQLRDTAQVEAVRRFHEEQVYIRRERRRLLAQRLGSRVRTKRLLEKISDDGAGDLVRTLWRRWYDGVTSRQAHLRSRERANILQLIAAFSTPSIPSSTRRANVEMEYVPWHVTRYEAPSTVRRGMAPLEPIVPRSAPDLKQNTSSTHFRLARFQ